MRGLRKLKDSRAANLRPSSPHDKGPSSPAARSCGLNSTDLERQTAFEGREQRSAPLQEGRAAAEDGLDVAVQLRARGRQRRPDRQRFVCQVRIHLPQTRHTQNQSGRL